MNEDFVVTRETLKMFVFCKNNDLHLKYLRLLTLSVEGDIQQIPVKWDTSYNG